jgi:putative ABC transport system permease protein
LLLPGEQTDEGAFNIASQFAPSTLFVDDVTELKTKGTLIDTDDIQYATFFGGVLHFGEQKLTGFPAGISPGAVDVFNVKINSGRGIDQTDLDQKKPVILLSEKVVQKLGAKLGDKVTIGTNQFEIIGLFTAEETISIGQSTDDMYFVPVTVATAINQSNQINRVVVKAKTAEQVDAAVTEIKAILTAKHGSNDFTVQLPSDILDQFNTITDILAMMVVGIASISLLVGGIGISNIMLVTVTERTREIGIRKAVGATEMVILLQFLIESIVLTVIGALIGIGMAALTGILIARYSPLDPSLTSQTIILALGMAALTGIVFGLFPAIRAARKNPVEALRFE